MKKTLSILTTTVMILVGFQVVMAAGAKLENGGFEAKLASWTAFAPQNGPKPTIEAVKISPHSGSYCSKLTPKADSGAMLQNIKGTLPKSVVISCWAKGDGQSWMDIVPMKSGKPQKGKQYPTSEKITGKKDWTKISLSFTPQTDAEYYELHLWGRKSQVFFDDVELTETKQVDTGIFKEAVKTELASPGTKLLFTIVMHIEPHQGGKNPDYREERYFRQQAEALKKFCAVLEKHGVKLTIQAQPPFTESCLKYENPLPEMSSKGHEVCAHFHEDVWVSNNASRTDRKKALEKVKKSVENCGVTSVETLCGGWKWPDLGSIASELGFKYLDNYKYSYTQKGLDQNMTVFPYRVSDTDITKKDAKGKCLYLPEGVWTNIDKPASLPSHATTEDFDNLTKMINNSLPKLIMGRLCVCNVVMHLSDFSPNTGDKDIALYDEYLTKVLDPHIKTGLIQPTTIGGMGRLFEQTEEQGIKPLPYLIAVINQNYWEKYDEGKLATANLRKQQSLCEKYSVADEHYFTWLAWKQTKEKDSGYVSFAKSKGIGIHAHGANRPPNPMLVNRMKNKDWEQDYKTAYDYETHDIDPKNGNLLTGVGGIAQIIKEAGTDPCSTGRTVHAPILAVDKVLGFKISVGLGEHNGAPSNRFFEMNMLNRPDDIFINPGEEFVPWVQGRLDLKKQLLEEIRRLDYTEPRFLMFVIHDGDMFNGKSEELRAKLWAGYDEMLKWLRKEVGLNSCSLKTMYQMANHRVEIKKSWVDEASRQIINPDYLPISVGKPWKELTLVELLQGVLSNKDFKPVDMLGPITFFDDVESVTIKIDQAKNLISKIKLEFPKWKSAPAFFLVDGIKLSAGQVLWLVCNIQFVQPAGEIKIPAVSNYPKAFATKFNQLQLWTARPTHYSYPRK